MTGKLPYTVERKGKLFWQPTPEMRAAGFAPKALGEDGPAARDEARRLYATWQERRGQPRAPDDPVSKYPAGSFGAYWDRFRETTAYAKKAPRTREDYERAWKRIEAWSPSPGAFSLAYTPCGKIGTELCEQFYDHLERTLSPNERHRTVKWFKILLSDMVTRMRYPYASPAARLVNPQPRGRSAIWLGEEIEDLAAVAAIGGFEGMSLAIDTAWETMFSPVDVRTLAPSQIKLDEEGFYIVRRRVKTDALAYAAVSHALGWALLAYIRSQGREAGDDGPVFRTRDIEPTAAGGRPRKGVPYATKDLFAKDFRAVRDMRFPGDARQLLDIRRSANVEADAAGADKVTMGELLANGLADNKFLEATYTPPTVTKARKVASERIEGRKKLAGEITRIRSDLTYSNTGTEARVSGSVSWNGL